MDSLVLQELCIDLRRPFEVPEGDRYVCLWEGCKSRNPTFGREAELQRHYSTQHVRSERFHCLAAVCIARDSKGFARLDKLQEHLRTYHHKDTLFMCPVTECDAGPLPPDLLHIHYHGHSVDIKNDADKKWTGYMSCCHNTCPLQGCDKLLATRFKEQYFPLHRVFHHDRHARSANASAILSAGYNPLSGWPLCPVCMIELENGWWGSYEEHFSGHEFELLHNHRRDILKIAPYFGERKAFQPVFADIMPTVARREGLD